ncbi:hypothetical protein K469DRAFT_241794 [Zopfia rhizophila CBS 207.26]|uniref:Uncharacterized protein n=1 Tax=Zopfia rhizophila CBS 207.26 TaxID=1314779 RepID=A0A6A6ENJ1_9PEZI|nr:hypothetical protein K469DRAFT_241794 [Zopfia rhizophila CBS 207.26]
MSDQPSVPPTMLARSPNARDEDPFTLALRGSDHIGIDELISLNRNNSLTVACSSAAPTTSFFSSHKGSSVTKPTSAGTSYPIEGKGKDKAVATYASSLSATHGSGSDTELEAIRDNALFGVGDWIGDGARTPRMPKGSTRTIKRPRRPKAKKPVVIQQTRHGSASEEDEGPATEKINHRDGRGKGHLR